MSLKININLQIQHFVDCGLAHAYRRVQIILSTISTAWHREQYRSFTNATPSERTDIHQPRLLKHNALVNAKRLERCGLTSRSIVPSLHSGHELYDTWSRSRSAVRGHSTIKVNLLLLLFYIWVYIPTYTILIL